METQVLENLLRDISKKIGDISYHLNKPTEVEAKISGDNIVLSERGTVVTVPSPSYADKDATATRIKELEARVKTLEGSRELLEVILLNHIGINEFTEAKDLYDKLKNDN